MRARLASLHSAEASLVLECCADAAPLWRHLGARVEPGEMAQLADGRTAASFSLGQDIPLSVAPPAGLGWFGASALALSRDGAACVVLFDAVDVSQTGAAITISLRDSHEGVLLEQRITLAPGGAFLCDARVENTGSAAVTVDWLAR